MRKTDRVYEVVYENEGWKGVLLRKLPDLCVGLSGEEVAGALNTLSDEGRIFFECECCVSNTEETRVKTDRLLSAEEV